MRKRLWRILLMKNKTLKHYKRKKFFYQISPLWCDVRSGVDDLFRSNIAVELVDFY